jgi:hypothetical protein
MSTIDVLNAEGAIVPVELPLVPGRAAAAVSRPVALSNEDKAALDLLHTDLAAGATAANQSTANTALASIQTSTAAGSTAANQATAQTNFGAVADAAWSGTGSGSLISIQKYLAAKIEAVRALLAGTLTVAGAGNFATTVADGANISFGTKADAKSTATDTTPVSAMSVWKQISASMQALVSAFGSPGPQTSALSTSVVPSSDIPFSVVDGGSGVTTVWGVSGVPVNNADMTAGTLVTDVPTTSQKIVVDDILISVSADMNVTLKEETSGTVLFGPWYCSAKSGPIQVTLRGKKKLATANKRVQAFASVAGNITVHLGYHSEA